MITHTIKKHPEKSVLGWHYKLFSTELIILNSFIADIWAIAKTQFAGQKCRKIFQINILYIFILSEFWYSPIFGLAVNWMVFTDNHTAQWNVLVDINPACIYLFKVNNRNTRAEREMCSEVTIRTPAIRQLRLSGVVIVNFEHISRLVLVSFVHFEQVNAG